MSRRSLRSQISYVGQDVFLFRATIRENIAFGRPGASDADIVAAAKAAQAHDFISAFPQGYDTFVGERGAGLSGGERQRVAIARALIKDAPLILLDEATASLDSESEHYVQKAIAELCKGRTTLVIAHRLSTIMHADKILVIEAGRGHRFRPPRRAAAQGRTLRLVLPPPAPAARKRASRVAACRRLDCRIFRHGGVEPARRHRHCNCRHRAELSRAATSVAP